MTRFRKGGVYRQRPVRRRCTSETSSFEHPGVMRARNLSFARILSQPRIPLQSTNQRG